MDNKKLIKKVKKILDNELGIDYRLSDLQILDSGNISGYITSGSFVDTDQEARQKKMWDILKKYLSDPELMQISLILTMTADEIQDDDE